MTSRERLLAALSLREPDRVPVATHSPFLFPSHVLGVALDDLDSVTGTYPVWKAELETARLFGFDAYVGSRVAGKQNAIKLSFPHATRSLTSFEDKEKRKWTDIVTSTPAGDLVERRCCPKGGPDWCIKPLVDDPETDRRKIEYLLDADFSRVDLSEHRMIQKEVGNDGVVRVHIDTPLTWWITMRGENGLIDLYDHRHLIQSLFTRYQEYCCEYVRMCQRNGIDLVWFHGVYDGATFAGPEVLDRWVYPFLTAMRRCASIPFVHYLSGHCMVLLEREAEAGINAITPLESPPMGDVDLAEVKRRVGKRLCLKGNIDPVNIMERGTPGDVEREVKRCVREAAEGGGFILSPSDQITNRTPVENVVALVQAARHYSTG